MKPLYAALLVALMAAATLLWDSAEAQQNRQPSQGHTAPEAEAAAGSTQASPASEEEAEKQKPPEKSPGPAYLLEVDGIINPGIKGYIKLYMEKAEKQEASVLIIRMDTPGGTLKATKKIVKLFLAAQVPVVVYVAPAGASATSAGMMITVGAHIAVMAPGTNIGAAHPVMMPFGAKYEPVPEDDPMMEKATKDTAAWVRSVCEVRGRNADWAEKAVKESESITATEAVEKNVADGTAADVDELVNSFLPGRVVKLGDGSTLSLHTRGARIEKKEMTTPQKLQDLINNPNVIIVLLLLGGLLVALEFKNPGMFFPVIIGAGLILLALLAPSLSINYIGLLLIILAFAFFVAEVFIVSYGLLSVAGVAAIVIGSLMLFNTKEAPNVYPSLPLIISLAVFIVVVIFIFGGAILQAHRRRVSSGADYLVGMEAEAASEIGPDTQGKIFVFGEYWNAVSDSPVAKGDKVVIKSINADNLRAHVTRKSAPSPEENQSG
ncbi:MAG: NfeD family protein [bacterium]